MFRLRCIVRVEPFRFSSSKGVELYKDLELPFPPYPGLLLRDGDWEFTISSIGYYMKEGIFKSFEIDKGPLDGERSNEEIVEIVDGYVESGWKVRLEKTVFCIDGQILFEEPWAYGRLYKKGQEVIHEYKSYVVEKCEFKGKAMQVQLAQR